MKLYHGSITVVREPRIIHAETGRDFGAAFYTTDIKEQAERRARRHRLFAKRSGNTEAQAIVSVFEYDNTAAENLLSFLNFPIVSLEWLNLIVLCRRNCHYSHGYDIVTGKVADDDAGETVAYVTSGVMRNEDAVKRLMFQKINNQIAFCSEQALTFLKYDFSYNAPEVYND